MTRSRRTPLYGNCIITAPDGQALCRTNPQRLQWYVDRNLGEIVCDDPKTLRLFFEPSGRNGADHPYTTSYKENKCVVCGKENEITRHHVIPVCFRKHFPESKKKHALHDVLILCINCHNYYENYAHEYKKKIAEEMGVPIGGTKNEILSALFPLKRAANALAEFYDVIPEPRKTELLNVLREHYHKQEITREDILEILKLQPDPKCKHYGELVVDQLESLDEFVLKWRKHFVEVMKPRYLPAHWDVNNIL